MLSISRKWLVLLALCAIYLHAQNLNTKLIEISQNPQWKALLHYRGKSSLIPKDSRFFLSKNGYKSVINELEATLALMDSQEGKEKLFCYYPARAKFLSQFFPHIQDSIKQMLCAEYEEFRIIVPEDKISLVFAGESDIYPGSAMGHIYLALQGEAKQDFTKTFNNTQVLSLHKGQEIGYSVSFFANTDLGINPIAYIKAISGNLDGTYALMPLENSTFEYIENEKRSLWELELKLNKAQKDMLLAHLWELKDIPIDYSFVTHNCNDALKILLSVADEAYNTYSFKPYQTPTEYIRALNSAGLITHINVKVPDNKQGFVQKYGKNDIFHTRDSAKFTFGYESFADSYLSIYFAPVYSDITNINNAYTEIIESRLLSIDMQINLKNNRGFIRKIEGLHLFSLADTFRTKSFAKYIDVSFVTPLYESSQTALKPQMSFGAGIGSYIGRINVFCMPLVGYEYIKEHNIFLDMRFGALLRFDRVRFIGSYDYYIDSMNKRGYKQHIKVFMGVNIYKQWDLYLKAQFYGNAKILPQNDFVNLSVGLSVNL